MNLFTPNPALEAISFQDPGFALELAEVFGDFAGQPVVLTRDQQTKLCRELNAITLKRFGANIEYICSTDGFYLDPPRMTSTNVLQSMFAGETKNAEDGLKIIRTAQGEVKGLVDLNKAKLSGVFSEFKPTLNVDLTMLLGSKFTPGELAAITLHEIGHYFTFCEMVRHVACTNQILSGLDRVLRGQDVRQIDIAFEEAGRELGVEKTVIEEVKKADPKIAVTILVTQSCRNHRNEYGNFFYDINTTEMMADQFVARMGAGRDLMSALDKAYLNEGVVWRNTRLKWFMLSCLDVLNEMFEQLALVAKAAVVSGAFFYFGSMAGGLFIIGTLFVLLFLRLSSGSGVTISDALYETPEVRCLRVRRQLIELAKDPKVNATAAKKILEDCAFLEKTAARYREFPSMWESIGRAIFSSNRRIFNSRDLQRDLEALALNDLFLKSLELKHA